MDSFQSFNNCPQFLSTKNTNSFQGFSQIHFFFICTLIINFEVQSLENITLQFLVHYAQSKHKTF